MNLRRLPYEVLAYTALALCSGMLLRMVFPGYDLRWLAAVALAPLLVALARTESAGLRFFYGWIAGVVYWFGLCTWIQFVLEVHGGMGRWGGWGSFLLFCVLKALHLGVFAWLAGPLMWRPWALPAIAALWVGLERTHGTFGFAWLALGNAGIDMSMPLRLAPFVGVYGLSFVFVMLAAAVATVLLRYPRTHLWPLAALGLLFLLPPIPSDGHPKQRALVIQPNIDPDEVWTFGGEMRAEQHLEVISDALPAPLVVWPEMPVPFDYYDDPQVRSEAQAIARRHGAFLLGTVAYNAAHQPLNSALLLGPQGNVINRYDKIYLVPFGEYVPRLFSFVNRVTQEAGDFAPGHQIKVLDAPQGRLGVFICYEAAFPHLVRQFAAQGATVFFNLSNDGYFGHSAAREQHLLLVRMRAVENRRYIVRATNDGLTVSIDPSGRILRELPPYREVAAVMPFDTVSDTTFYTRHGDWFAWLCLVAGVALSLQTQIASHVRRRAR